MGTADDLRTYYRLPYNGDRAGTVTVYWRRVYDLLEKLGIDPLDYGSALQACTVVHNAMGKMRTDHTMVLALRYGIYNNTPKAVVVLSAITGVTRSAMSKMVVKSRDLLKARLLTGVGS